MKNPFKTMSARTIRIVYTMGALFVLVISLDRFLEVMFFRVTTNDQCAWLTLPTNPEGLLIQGVVKGGVTDRAGIVNGDTLLKINGYALRASPERKQSITAMAQAIIDSIKAGDYATYTVKRGNALIEAKVEMGKIFDIRFLSLFFLGLGFFLVGYIVVMTKPQGQIQRMFGRFGIFALLLFAIFQPQLGAGRDPQWKVILLLACFVVARIFASPLFVTFFLHFPVRKKLLDRKWVVPAIYAFNLVIILLIFLFLRSAPTWLQVLLFFSPFFFFIAGLVVFIHSYFTGVDARRRSQLRPVLISVAVGILAFLYGIIGTAIDPFAVFLKPILILPIALTVFVPLAFGYAIFRYRLMDIDLIIKRSLIYGAVTATLAAIYMLTVFGVGSLLSVVMGQPDSKVLNIAAFIVIAFAFDPLKRHVQEDIDKLFYRERRNYQRALLEFSQELPRQMNLEQILSSMVQRISTTMHVEKIAVVLCDGSEGCSCVSRGIPEGYCRFIEGNEGLMGLLRSTKAAHSFALLSEEPDAFHLDAADKEQLLRSGVVLAVPMFLQERLIGTINVGSKLSGKIYSQEDIDLLSTVAGQAAIAIENARLHRSEIEKHKIEEELNMARRIQEGLLPKFSPEIAGLDIDGVSLPALTVGGDYFDYILLGPQKVLVVVADVSGKGMSASLYMSKVQGMVQLAAQMYESPKEILVNVNRRLYDGMERKSFITMIVALFDTERKEVRICRAGHHKAIMRTNGDLQYLDSKGIGLGLERGPIFESELEEIRRPLQPGSLFVFYSDGLTEAMNGDQAEFGEANVFRIVRAGRELPARELQQSIIRETQQFQGDAEQHDDMTVVVVRST